MLDTYVGFISHGLETWQGQGLIVLLFFLAGFTTALLPETVVTILPRLAGHVYKRIYFAVGMVISVIGIGVVFSWILGPSIIGKGAYYLWSALLVAMALQCFEWVAFIHPAPLGGLRTARRTERKSSTAQRLLSIMVQGIRVGATWRYDRLPIYIWLIAGIALVGWRLASLMTIAFILGDIIPIFWLTNRMERLAGLVTKPDYRRGIRLFKRLMGIIMLLEALYFVGHV